MFLIHVELLFHVDATISAMNQNCSVYAMRVNVGQERRENARGCEKGYMLYELA